MLGDLKHNNKTFKTFKNGKINLIHQITPQKANQINNNLIN